MTREEMQKIVDKMNAETATEEEIDLLDEWAKVVWKWNEEEERMMYMIFETVSYYF